VATLFCRTIAFRRIVVGLYFSAHWCPPCRGFTPDLADFYNQTKQKVGDKLEIVFISSDRTEGDWKGYFSEMPWLALPFTARDVKVIVVADAVIITVQVVLLFCIVMWLGTKCVAYDSQFAEAYSLAGIVYIQGVRPTIKSDPQQCFIISVTTGIFDANFLQQYYCHPLIHYIVSFMNL